MIGKLTGRVDSVASDHAIIDVGGVGYLVHCPSSTLSRLSVGSTVSLAIETKMSEEGRTTTQTATSTTSQHAWNKSRCY